MALSAPAANFPLVQNGCSAAFRPLARLLGRYVLAFTIAVVHVRIDLAGSRGMLFGGRALALRPLRLLLRGELGLLRAPGLPGLLGALYERASHRDLMKDVTWT